MSEPLKFTLQLEQQQGFEFRVKFDWPEVPDLLLDEPEPLGAKHGPNAARILAAAVANCLSASLLFCMRNKFRQNPGPLRASVTGRLERNERGRVRVGALDVELQLSDKAEEIHHLDRCNEQFEDFCVVTESIRRGIPVGVRVLDSARRTVYENNGGEKLAA